MEKLKAVRIDTLYYEKWKNFAMIMQKVEFHVENMA